MTSTSDKSESDRPDRPVRDTPRASREETTARILDAADELFSARNPRDVTVRAVAEKAGVTHALVHQYVGTKEDLLNATIQRVATNRTSIVEDSETLRSVIPVLLQDILTNRTHSKTMVRSAMDGVEYLSLKDRIPTGRALMERAAEDIAEGREPAPAPTDVDPKVVLAAITSLVFGWVALEDWLWHIFDLDPANRDDIHRQVTEVAAYVSDLVLQQNEKG